MWNDGSEALTSEGIFYLPPQYTIQKLREMIMRYCEVNMNSIKCNNKKPIDIGSAGQTNQTKILCGYGG